MTRSPDDLLVLNSEQVMCIASPARSELLGAAVRLRQFSINELGELTGRNPKALYPHVRAMQGVGLIKQVDQRLSGKRIEAIYAPVSTRIELPRDNFDPEYRKAVRQKLRGVIRQTEREHLRYLDSITDEDLSVVFRLFLKLPPSRIPELKQRLADIGRWATGLEEEPEAIEIGATFLAAPLK